MSTENPILISNFIDDLATIEMMRPGTVDLKRIKTQRIVFRVEEYHSPTEESMTGNSRNYTLKIVINHIKAIVDLHMLKIQAEKKQLHCYSAYISLQ